MDRRGIWKAEAPDKLSKWEIGAMGFGDGRRIGGCRSGMGSDQEMVVGARESRHTALAQRPELVGTEDGTNPV